MQADRNYANMQSLALIALLINKTTKLGLFSSLTMASCLRGCPPSVAMRHLLLPVISPEETYLRVGAG